MQFKNEGKLDDLNRANEYSQKGISIISQRNPDRATFLNSLSACFFNRYEREGGLDDLDQAIKYVQDAIYLTPELNPSRAEFLSNLSAGLIMRFMKEGKLMTSTM